MKTLMVCVLTIVPALLANSIVKLCNPLVAKRFKYHFQVCVHKSVAWLMDRVETGLTRNDHWLERNRDFIFAVG
jgi:hypothetical protein